LDGYSYFLKISGNHIDAVIFGYSNQNVPLQASRPAKPSTIEAEAAPNSLDAMPQQASPRNRGMMAATGSVRLNEDVNPYPNREVSIGAQLQNAAQRQVGNLPSGESLLGSPSSPTPTSSTLSALTQRALAQVNALAISLRNIQP
jgi:hypothetical protein